MQREKVEVNKLNLDIWLFERKGKIRVREEGENQERLEITLRDYALFVGEVRLEAMWSIGMSFLRHINLTLYLEQPQNCLPLFFEVLATRTTTSSPHLQMGLNPYPWNHEYEIRCNLVAPNYYNKRRKMNGDETYLTNTNSNSPSGLCTQSCWPHISCKS